MEELLDMYRFPIGVQMLIIEMMARWRIRLSYGAKKDVGEVRLENGIIQGDAFSPLLFVLMRDPLIRSMKNKMGNQVEVLYRLRTKYLSADKLFFPGPYVDKLLEGEKDLSQVSSKSTPSLSKMQSNTSSL